MTTRDYVEIENLKVFWRNGILHSAGEIVNSQTFTIKKYNTDGSLAETSTFKHGKLLSKEVINRDGTVYQTFNYTYTSNGSIDKISRYRVNVLDTVVFLRDNQNIIGIRVKHNNVIIRKLDFEYSDNRVHCIDCSEHGNREYYCLTPVDDERWFQSLEATSLIMRKIKTALAVTV